MDVDQWIPPRADREVGLGFYASQSPPVEGRIKEDAEDFRVQEISAYPMPDPAGTYTVLRVRSRDWEQHELAQRLSARLGLSPHAISWAGTKDRRAVSERLFSYRGAPPARPVDLEGATIVEAYRARDGLVLGHHFGNSFEIRVSQLSLPPIEAVALFEATRLQLVDGDGLPNFFGLQRFGEVRPVTHRVGRELVRGDPGAAVETYLTFVEEGVDGMGVEARRRYAAEHDAVAALRDLPAAFRFERRLLDHLARGNGPERALGSLTRELRRLFVHAYQALLFNRWLDARRNARIPLGRAEAGDHLLRRGADGTIRTLDPIPVVEDNLPEAQELVARARAVVAGPLVGYETPSEDGPVGRLLSQILSDEGVRAQDFRLPKTPELASAGSWRPAVLPIPPISIREDAPATSGSVRPGVWFRFSLPRGSYATVLLREFLKAGATHP
ncbi:MAG TPA: tRNA pseudouridine(13) synthase TruD [Thermoplasmata archaeon]|nr:tRNA pseudouridine(13) synthase TruD [Thermoplasmata archaeon]